MNGFLIVVLILVLLMDLLALFQLWKHKTEAYLRELEESAKSNGMVQVYYAITGVYVLLLLLVMKQLPVMTIPGAVLAVDSLLLVLLLRQAGTNKLYIRFYRGPGIWLSGLGHTAFAAMALYLLIQA